jgi:hypothetical protein
VLILIAIGDGIWIGTNMKMYNDATVAIQGSDIRMNPYGAIISYVCLYALLVLFAVPMVLDKVGGAKMSLLDKLFVSLRYGGLLGLLTYGIYNFTCLAILKKYPMKVAILDTLWGGMLFTIVCLVCTML